jgi:rhodanese-related sulfurtransferase
MAKKQVKQSTKPAAWVWILGAAVLALILVGVFVLPRLGADKAGLPAEVSTAEGYKLREEGVFVLDVREPSEWAEAHIPGATLIPLGELEARVSEVPAGQPVLVYCRSGNRSQTGRDILLKAGFTQVTSMAGGIREWSAAGYPTEAGN